VLSSGIADWLPKRVGSQRTAERTALPNRIIAWIASLWPFGKGGQACRRPLDALAVSLKTGVVSPLTTNRFNLKKNLTIQIYLG
jgi:hypothetical protein